MEKPNNRVIKRAVELWCRKLRTPVFDNGDQSETGGVTMCLATINIQNDKSKIKDIEESIETFRTVLTGILIQVRDIPLEGERFPMWLDVDYHPCKELAYAADKAGIPHSQFSCKSSVSMRENFLSTSFGYGREDINHYPLGDDKWLMTTLCGSDAEIQKIKNDAMDDNLLEWEIE